MAPGDGFRLDGKLLDQLKAEAGSLASAARDRAVLSVRQNLGNAASRLARYAESGGGPGLMGRGYRGEGPGRGKVITALRDSHAGSGQAEGRRLVRARRPAQGRPGPEIPGPPEGRRA